MPSLNRSSVNKPQLSPFQKRQKMSLTQTYYLAHTARAKLSKEAARADHDLRLLVGHANLLDGLMIDLADAEREQESWFNSTVAKNNSTVASEPKHIQWSDSLPSVEEYDEDSDSSDSDSDDDMVVESTSAPLRRIRSPPAQFVVSEEAIEDDDEEEDFEDLQLVRTPSRSSPPELLHEHDSESDSDDDMSPPSPPQPEIPLDAFSTKQHQLATAGNKQTISITAEEQEEAFYQDGFYLPQRQQVAAY